MTSLLKIIALLMLAASAAFSQETVKENVHYKVLDWEKRPNLVTEVFSVYCSHCYRYEVSVLPSLKASLPKGVIFEEMHLNKMGKYGQAATNVLAVVKTINESKYHEVKMAYFEAIFVDRTNFPTENDFIEFGLKKGGISKGDYEKELKSLKAEALIKRWDNAVEIAVMQGTPSIVVNNKYLVIASSIKSVEHFNEIVNYLLQKL